MAEKFYATLHSNETDLIKPYHQIGWIIFTYKCYVYHSRLRSYIIVQVHNCSEIELPINFKSFLRSDRL